VDSAGLISRLQLTVGAQDKLLDDHCRQYSLALGDFGEVVAGLASGSVEPGRHSIVTSTAPGTLVLIHAAQDQFLRGFRPRCRPFLLVVEHHGPTMFTRIGVMKALNRHVERVFDPSRKDHHWGRRKLKRGQ
jgi:hypothetical protein